MTNTDRLKTLQIIVCDINGTLLNSEGEIGQESKKLIHQLQRHDVIVTLASARMYSAVKPYADELEIKTPVICIDGALIKNPQNENILFESFVKERYVKKAINMADQMLLKIALCQDDAIVFTEHNSAISMLLDKYGAKFREIQSYSDIYHKTLEVIVVGENDESVKLLRNKLDFPYAFGLSTFYYKSQSKKGIYYLEIRKKGSSKGTGLLRLMKHLRIKPADAAVIGDWYNDISLFSTPAFKVAMKNAVPELRRLANHITTKTNNEDGTAGFFENVLRAKRGNV